MNVINKINPTSLSGNFALTMGFGLGGALIVAGKERASIFIQELKSHCSDSFCSTGVKIAAVAIESFGVIIGGASFSLFFIMGYSNIIKLKHRIQKVLDPQIQMRSNIKKYDQKLWSSLAYVQHMVILPLNVAMLCYILIPMIAASVLGLPGCFLLGCLAVGFVHDLTVITANIDHNIDHPLSEIRSRLKKLNSGNLDLLQALATIHISAPQKRSVYEHTWIISRISRLRSTLFKKN